MQLGEQCQGVSSQVGVANCSWLSLESCIVRWQAMVFATVPAGQSAIVVQQ